MEFVMVVAESILNPCSDRAVVLQILAIVLQ